MHNITNTYAGRYTYIKQNRSNNNNNNNNNRNSGKIQVMQWVKRKLTV